MRHVFGSLHTAIIFLQLFCATEFHENAQKFAKYAKIVRKVTSIPTEKNLCTFFLYNENHLRSKPFLQSLAIIIISRPRRPLKCVSYASSDIVNHAAMFYERPCTYIEIF